MKYRPIYMWVAAVVLGALISLFARAALSQTRARQDSSDMMSSRGSAVHPSEWTSTAVTVGTSPVYPFAADQAATSINYVQNIRLVNRSTGYVCFAPVLKVGSCSSTCSGASLTCSGAATDGDAIAAGNTYSVSITGDACACVVAASAGSSVGAVRVQRWPR